MQEAARELIDEAPDVVPDDWLLCSLQLFAPVVVSLLVALFPATVLPPSETYLLYVYCVLVIRAWTDEYAQGRMSIHVYCVLDVRLYACRSWGSGGFRAPNGDSLTGTGGSRR